MKVSVDDFAGPSGSWDIEIWLTTKPEHTGFDLVERLKRDLNKKQREIIMHLKQHYYKQGLLKDGMSKKIYLAVINKNVTSIEAFEAYLKRL